VLELITETGMVTTLYYVIMYVLNELVRCDENKSAPVTSSSPSLSSSEVLI